MKYPPSAMKLNEKECKHIMQPIAKFVLTRAGISSTRHTAVKYGPRSLRGIENFDPFVIQGTVRIVFLIEHYWNSTPSITMLRSKLSTLQLEYRRGGHIL